MTKAEVENKDEAMDALTKIISEEMDDYIIIIESPYVNFVEYGTMPAKTDPALIKVEDFKSPIKKEFITPTRLRMRDWVEKKEHVSGQERRKRGDKMYRHIMNNGLKPHPFIRPAIRDAEYTLPDHSPEKFEEVGFMGVYAGYIAERMKYYLEKNGTDGLIGRIKVEKADDYNGAGKEFDPEKKDVNGRGAF